MGTLSRDTDTSAEKALIAVMKALPVWKKLELLDDACETTRALMLAGLRRRSPAISEKELHGMLMAALVGEETAELVWGPRVESNR
jgi:hypothetical protein